MPASIKTKVFNLLPPALIAVVLLLEPIGAALLAWLILSEAPSRGIWWGGALLLASVAWVSLQARKPFVK